MEELKHQLNEIYNVSYDEACEKIQQIIRQKFGGMIFELFTDLEKLSTAVRGTPEQQLYWTLMGLNIGDYSEKVLKIRGEALLTTDQFDVANKIGVLSNTYWQLFHNYESFQEHNGMSEGYMSHISQYLFNYGEEPAIGLSREVYKMLKHIDEKDMVDHHLKSMSNAVFYKTHLSDKHIKGLYRYLTQYKPFDNVSYTQYDAFCVREKILKNDARQDYPVGSHDLQGDPLEELKKHWNKYSALVCSDQDIRNAINYAGLIDGFMKSEKLTDCNAVNEFVEEYSRYNSYLLPVRAGVMCGSVKKIKKKQIEGWKKDEHFLAALCEKLSVEQKKQEGPFKGYINHIEKIKEYLHRYGEATEHGITQARVDDYLNKYVYVARENNE